MDNTNRTVYVISGPTASGKTDVAYNLAKIINGEIVNCDSVQLYKYMNIGSAMPPADMMSEVKHHLFGIVEPDYRMTVAKYQQLALAVIENILKRGKTPIVVGGTGLYLNSILYKMDFAGTEPDAENTARRSELEKMAEEHGADYMHNYLSGIDPESAERIHPNNIRKVIRAIEAYEMGDGVKNMDNLVPNTDYDFKFYVINMNREYLYERINLRVINLVKAGLLDEVETLIKMGYTLDTPSMKGIGYKELIAFKNGDCSLKDAIEEIMKNTRHYAKRQITWLKRYDNAKWIDVAKGEPISNTLNKILHD